MSMHSHSFGQTTIAKISNSDELKQIMVDPWLKSETIILKPNWGSSGLNEPAGFSDSETLRMVFEAIDSRFVVTESHQIHRLVNLFEEEIGFAVGGKEVTWKWLLKGAGWNWIIENPDWGWCIKDYWNRIRQEDKVFLDENGFTDLFNEFGVSFINVTDEVWSGRVADPVEVKKSVENRYKPVIIDEMYSMIPKKLYDLRGTTFISFAKLKTYISFTMKNLFGMIPDPLRPWWHGFKNSRIASSIIDINKVYRSLFNVYGICEALKSRPASNPEGKFEGTYSGKYNVVKNEGFIAFSRDLVSLDAILCNLTGLNFKQYGDYINLAQDEFGIYDKQLLEESKKLVGNWLLQ
jgi:hypothetical protein